jgi:uncharacterized damage-inducible protein DinB
MAENNIMAGNTIRQLLDYNRWANQKMLGAVGTLAPEKFIRNLGSSFGSVRDTLVHTMWAEWLWLMRWQGKSPREIFDPQAYPDLASLRDRWSVINSDQVSFVSALTDASLEKVLSYTNMKAEVWSYPLWQMVYHTINHSAYHRGQIVTMLRQLESDVATTDFLVYIDELSPRP